MGNAIHTLQDSTSPAHEGFQVWLGASFFVEALEHVKAENFDPGVNSALDKITRRAWSYFTGDEPLPADFFAPAENDPKPAPGEEAPKQ
jgi:hypothetical protein